MSAWGRIVQRWRERGNRRAAAALEAQLRSERAVGWKDATPARSDATVLARGVHPDVSTELGWDRRLLVDRAQQLERQNPIARALLDRSVESVVGNGFRLQPRTADDRWNGRASELWERWSRDEADERRILTMPRIAAVAYRSMMRDGDFAVAFLEDGSLRTIESAEIATPWGGYFQPRMVDGIEHDTRGRALRYHTFRRWFQNDTVWADRRIAVAGNDEVVPADSVAFIARRDRADQTRGVTVFNSLFWTLEQIEGSLEATTMALRMAACVGLVIARNSPITGLQGTQTSHGQTRRRLDLEPGGVLQLYPGETATPIDPKHPAETFEPFLRLLFRMAGQLFGLPLEIAFSDFSESNYSSFRGSMLQTQRTWRYMQADVERWLRRIWLWRCAKWIEDGELEMRDDWTEHRWIAPGWSWSDPEDEVQAQMAAVDANLDTLTDICHRNGRDFDEVLAERAAETAAIKAAGLPDIRGSLTRDAVELRESYTETKSLEPKNGAARNGRSRLPL